MNPVRNFPHPDDVEKAWNEFKDDLKIQANEWVKIQYAGKEGDQKLDPQKVPMTLEGFKRFCRKNYGCVHQYFENKDGLYDEYVGICSYIIEEIRENQIIGGLLGFYNASITQRLNNLKEQTESEIINKEVPLFPDTDVRKDNSSK